jgi:tellurite resistance protein TehA-like permease
MTSDRETTVPGAARGGSAAHGAPSRGRGTSSGAGRPRGSAAAEMLRTLNPGYFAFVMATGIVSAAAHHLGLHHISAALLLVTILGWALLAVAYCWRALAFRAAFLADLWSPATGFAYFTVVAGCTVLAGRLGLDGHRTAASVLIAIGTVTWLALSYAVPLRVITGTRAHGVLEAANGTWLVWVVATQSLSTAASSLLGLWPAGGEGLTLLAVAFWGVGVVLYLVLVTVVLIRLLLFPVHAEDLTPPYWISMGATAITVLAGDRLLQLPPQPMLTAMTPVITGLSLVLWAFGTWLWPPLIARTVRRATLRNPVRARYRPTLWTMVFPFGMYSVSSTELGTIARAPWIHGIGLAEGWLALATWCLVFLAMLVSFPWRLRRGLRVGHGPRAAVR